MSRIPPKMEQKAAIKAKVYHVLPVSINGQIYSVETLSLNGGKGQAHEVVCKAVLGNEIWRMRVYERQYELTLETDVQEVYAVDLYVEGEKVFVKLEYRDPIVLSTTNGQLLK